MAFIQLPLASRGALRSFCIASLIFNFLPHTCEASVLSSRNGYWKDHHLSFGLGGSSVREIMIKRASNQTLAFNGFQLAEDQSLAGLGLDYDCEQTLYQTLYCDDLVSTLSDPVYHDSPGDTAVTDSVCDAGCQAALVKFHNSVVEKCGASLEILPGFPALAFIDSVWGGWNETCLKDNQTGQYCNGESYATWRPP